MDSKSIEILYLIRQLAEKKPNKKKRSLIRLGIEKGSRYIGRAVQGWVVGQLLRVQFWELLLRLIG